MRIYKEGETIREDGAYYKTYAIDEIGGKVPHTGKIVIYGDEELRQIVINLLNSEGIAPYSSELGQRLEERVEDLEENDQKFQAIDNFLVELSGIVEDLRQKL